MENLAIENLSFTYAGAEEPVLRGVNLRLREGEFALLTGGTGCGKTTLLTLIKRELAPRGELRGRILFRGRETGTFSDREAAEKVRGIHERLIAGDSFADALEQAQLFDGLQSRMVRVGIAAGREDIVMAEIAEQTGYANLTYFYRIVRKAYGITPHQMRREETAGSRP